MTSCVVSKTDLLHTFGKQDGDHLNTREKERDSMAVCLYDNALQWSRTEYITSVIPGLLAETHYPWN
jgi:hypothetical protein